MFHPVLLIQLHLQVLLPPLPQAEVERFLNKGSAETTAQQVRIPTQKRPIEKLLEEHFDSLAKTAKEMAERVLSLVTCQGFLQDGLVEHVEITVNETDRFLITLDAPSHVWAEKVMKFISI